MCILTLIVEILAICGSEAGTIDMETVIPLTMALIRRTSQFES